MQMQLATGRACQSPQQPAHLPPSTQRPGRAPITHKPSPPTVQHQELVAGIFQPQADHQIGGAADQGLIDCSTQAAGERGSAARLIHGRGRAGREGQVVQGRPKPAGIDGAHC